MLPLPSILAAADLPMVGKIAAAAFMGGGIGSGMARRRGERECRRLFAELCRERRFVWRWKLAAKNRHAVEWAARKSIKTVLRSLDVAVRAANAERN